MTDRTRRAGHTSRAERAAQMLGTRARPAVPLAPYTTYRVGGPAALLVEVAGEDDLRAAAGPPTR